MLLGMLLAAMFGSVIVILVTQWRSGVLIGRHDGPDLPPASMYRPRGLPAVGETFDEDDLAKAA